MFRVSSTLRRGASARAVLGLREGQSYSPGDIKKAFREKALTAHPDAGGDPAYFRQLQAAYEVLLREHGVGKASTSAGAPSAEGEAHHDGFGFYAHPHARWDGAAGPSHRDYWRQVHEEEVNMNTNAHGSPEHPTNTHYRARPHQQSYGAGLGADFASASRAQRGADANFSTYYFYRPYESDYRNPYGNGFTEEELQEAKREQRRGMLRTIARHTLLWSGLAFIVYLHERNNRIRRATEAREKGYQDPEYWRQLREEEAEAKRQNRAPLRLEHHWLDAPVILPTPAETEEDSAAQSNTRNSAETGEGKTAQDARKMQERQLRALRPMAGPFRGAGGAAGPQVVSYQGRPFTPNGVRGARNAAPVTAKTLANDVTYDASDLDWEDEALD